MAGAGGEGLARRAGAAADRNIAAAEGAGAALAGKIRAASRKERALGAAAAVGGGLLVLWAAVHYLFGGHFDALFVAMEAAHIIGMAVLIRKLGSERSCEGLSLRTQELTAGYLLLRLLASVFYEGNHHTLLDAASLAATGWVIQLMRHGQISKTYDAARDLSPKESVKYLVLPCIVLGVLVNPGLTRVKGLLGFVTNSMWACSVYMEAVAVAPQLVMMRNIAEKKGYMERNSTAHYVFALGIARFLGCASWILQPRVLSYVFGQTRSFKLWGAFSLISELVQTLILADFCYYYIKSVVEGSLLVRFHSSV